MQALERDKICGNSHGKRWAKKRIQTARALERDRICGNSYGKHWMKKWEYKYKRQKVKDWV
ncbi:hypothetical protein LEP1GSC040_2483 [Leptospira santarosai str. 2000030832]|nr:hypothetical protein LEP1GSC040_2483 [Leptospira santarosai str. 2000030832]